MNKKHDVEFKWRANVEKARDAYRMRNLNQMHIAKLALEVCEITRGGAKMHGKYTIKRFAEEAGISAKILSGWIAVRRLVFERIPENLRRDVTYTKFAHVALRVTKDMPQEQIEKIFKKMVHGSEIEQRLQRSLRYLRSIAYKFEVDKAADKAEQETLEEVYFYSSIIRLHIKKVHPEIKAMNHGIAAKNDLRMITASKAFDDPSLITGKGIYVTDMGMRVRITPKDRDIANFMKTKNKFFSPTEIGQMVGGFSTKSATAWAGRTITKLISLDMIERNKYGHYRWKTGPHEKI